MRLSVIVPVLNGDEKFRKCLQSIQQSHRMPDELIIVIDGEDANSYNIAESFTNQIFVNQETKGPAIARNIGAKASTGDILIFFDADITVHKQTIGKMESYFETHAEVSALIGSYDNEPAEQNFMSQYKNLMNHYVHQHARLEASTFWGACGAIRRDAFFAVDGFNEQFTRPSMEDIELGYRLVDAGYLIHLVKDILVTHHKRWTPLKLLRSDIFDRAIPWSKLLLTQNRLTNDLNIDVTSRWSTILVYLLPLTLISSVLIPLLSILMIVWVCALLWLNRETYRFFFRHRGMVFFVRSLFWHWLYFFYSGTVFVMMAIYIRFRK